MGRTSSLSMEIQLFRITYGREHPSPIEWNQLTIDVLNEVSLICFHKMIVCVFSPLHTIPVTCGSDSLSYVESPLCPGLSPSWSWCVVLLISCWMRFASVLLRLLHQYSYGILSCNCTFPWRLCLTLVLACEFTSPPHPVSCKNLGRVSVRICQWATGPGICWEVFLFLFKKT